MCLQKITKRLRGQKVSDKAQIGYKLIAKVQDSLGRSRYLAYYMPTTYKAEGLNIDPKSSGVPQRIYFGKFRNKDWYRAGYHFYTKPDQIFRSADWWDRDGFVIVECAVWDIHTWGTDQHGDAFVGNKFKILREISDDKYIKASK